jgi:hypothetical protein
MDPKSVLVNPKETEIGSANADATGGGDVIENRLDGGAKVILRILYTRMAWI